MRLEIGVDRKVQWILPWSASVVRIGLSAWEITYTPYGSSLASTVNRHTLWLPRSPCAGDIDIYVKIVYGWMERKRKGVDGERG